VLPSSNRNVPEAQLSIDLLTSRFITVVLAHYATVMKQRLPQWPVFTDWWDFLDACYNIFYEYLPLRVDDIGLPGWPLPESIWASSFPPGRVVTAEIVTQIWDYSRGLPRVDIFVYEPDGDITRTHPVHSSLDVHYMKPGGTLFARSHAAEYGVGRSRHRMPPWDTWHRNMLPAFSEDALERRYAVTVEEKNEDARVRYILDSTF